MSFRGGGSRGGFSKQLLPFGLEYNDLKELEAHRSLNTLQLPINGPITQLEKETAQQYINFGKIISEGPFYTGSLQALKTAKDKNVLLYDDGDGINDGIKRYSDRFRKKRKIGRSIDEHPYILDFFPEELYSVMGVNKKNKKKLLSLSNYNKETLQDDTLKLINNKTDEQQKQERLDTLNNVTEGQGKEDEDDEGDEDDEDDEFDEDDDDDYNAEKYFDDGDDDDMGDDDGDDEAAF